MYNPTIISHILKDKHRDLRLESSFVDISAHALFDTCNFTLGLQNGHYRNVVCPPDHLASDTSLSGKSASRRAVEGGCQLTWVVSIDVEVKVKKRLGRHALGDHCKKIDGNDVGTAFGSVVAAIELTPADSKGESEIVAAHFMKTGRVVRLDQKTL